VVELNRPPLPTHERLISGKAVCSPAPQICDISREFKEFKATPMTKFSRIIVSLFALAIAAMAQTNTAASAPPTAPSATNSPSSIVTGSGSKVGTINIEQAIFATNEGQRDFEALNKKLEPKQNELKSMNDEVDSLKKQLNTQGDKLSADARANLVKQVEQKQKSLERSVQDAREDAQNQQNEIAQRILQKMAPIVVKYAGDNGFGLILDTSNPWPNGPVLWAGNSMDITKAVVDNYKTQSGVAAPPAGSRGATPPPKPAGATTPKPTTPKP
jgi:outer membrane protein